MYFKSPLYDITDFDIQGIKVEDIHARPYQEKLTFPKKISNQEMILHDISKAHSSDKQKKLTP